MKLEGIRNVLVEKTMRGREGVREGERQCGKWDRERRG